MQKSDNYKECRVSKNARHNVILSEPHQRTPPVANAIVMPQACAVALAGQTHKEPVMPHSFGTPYAAQRCLFIDKTEPRGVSTRRNGESIKLFVISAMPREKTVSYNTDTTLLTATTKNRLTKGRSKIRIWIYQTPVLSIPVGRATHMTSTRT